MGIRQYANENPKAALGATAGVLLATLLAVLRPGCSSRNEGQSQAPLGKVYFTVDDGKTYFSDTIAKIPPFTTADGKTAYRAVVVKCATGQPFVSHLEKYPDEEKKKLEETIRKAGGGSGALSVLHLGAGSNVLVKKPLTGDRDWVAFSPRAADQYRAITEPRCPDRSDPERVAAD
jgi:hypothetical protein